MAINFRARLLEFEDAIPEHVDRYLELVLDYPQVDAYTERHHILPKGLFPTSAKDPQNLVDLRGRDHLLAHYWLARALPGTPSVANAYLLMSCRDAIPVNKKLSRGHHLTAQDLPIPDADLLEQYEVSRIAWSEHMQGMFPARVKATGVCVQIPREQFDPELHEHWSTGKTCYKDAVGEVHYLPTDHPDVTSGKVTHINTGMTRAIDLTTNQIVHITSEDFAANPQRYEATNKGGLPGHHPNAGRTAILDETGAFRWVPRDTPGLDENLKSGFWAYPFAGKLTVKLATGGPSFNVDVDDPRLETGEVVPQSKGMATVVPRDGGAAFQVPKDDPRIATGELVAQNTGRIRVLDAQGQECRVYPNDPRLLTGELQLKDLNKDKAKLNVYDAAGKLWKVHPDDPRLVSGELAKKTERAPRRDKGTHRLPIP